MSHLAGKTCQTAAALLTGSFENSRTDNTLTHAHAGKYTPTHTHECKMSRAETNLLRWLYVSADPALIRQTKLSLLNAQQQSSLAVIMHPPRPAAPQSTALPSPLTSLTALSLPSAPYSTIHNFYMFINQQIGTVLVSQPDSHGGFPLLIPPQ